MTAVVIPVRPGDQNEELRFALRSIAAYVIDPEVWLVGWRPNWVYGTHWLPNRTRGQKADRGCQQARGAASSLQSPHEFWWWDDDMFRLTPLYGPETRHGGPMRDWLDRYERVDSCYARTVRRTAARLAPDALMYDLHVPMWIRDRHELATTMDVLPDGTGGWLWRTVHGNRLHLGGSGHPDVKVYGDAPVPEPPGQWLSCDDKAFTLMRPMLEKRFPEPSPWEGKPRARPAMGRYRRGEATREVVWLPGRDASYHAAGWVLESVD